MEYLVGAFVLFIFSLFVPVLRKTIGLLLVILGTVGIFSVFGAIFGIPMILFGGILLFIGNNRPNVIIQNKNTSIDENEIRIECPYCAELIKRTAKVCRFCGKDLPQSFIKRDEQKFTCINCYKIISPDLDTCPHCNAKLFSCENCNSYVNEYDTACWLCGTEFHIEEKNKFRGFLKRLLINKDK